LFQSHGSVGITANVRRLRIALCRDTLAFRDILDLRSLCPIEHCPAPKRGQSHPNHNYKRQVAFHAGDKRRIFDARTESSRAGGGRLQRRHSGSRHALCERIAGKAELAVVELSSADGADRTTSRVVRECAFFLIDASPLGQVLKSSTNRLLCQLISRCVSSFVRIQTFSIILGVVFMDVCACTGQTPSSEESGIEGMITVSPARPGPIRADEPASVPLAKATFVVENNNGQVASFTTDDQGHFWVSLPPGHYKVSLKGR